MGKISFSIHPLFFLFGIYYSLTGRIAVFLVYTIIALIHEFGHSTVAERRGYFLKNITLMPFGAVISGTENILNYKDELKIAFAGPLTNIFLGIFTVALWWIFPSVYPLTYIIAEANFSLAVINLFPFFPLDGGRILLALITRKADRKKALKICKIIGLIGGVSLFIFFVISIFNEINLSLLFFSLFILFGAGSRSDENIYEKITYGLDEKKIIHGVEIKRIAVDKTTLVKRIFQIIEPDKMIELSVFCDGTLLKTFQCKELGLLLLNADYCRPIGDYL